MTILTNVKTSQLISSLLCIGLLVLLLKSPPAIATVEAITFEDSTTLTRYQSLITELRCLVCQNQNLADSDADLAKDLRRKTAAMLNEGKTDQQILDYMSDRYGDFVLYRPPFNLRTSLIWVGPFLLLIIATTGLLINIRRRQRNELLQQKPTIDENQRNKIRAMMESAPALSNSDTAPNKRSY